MEPGAVFTVLFVMLGPLKILGPFAAQTRGIDGAAVRRIALHAFAIGLIGMLAGGFVGRALMHKWHISIPALLIAGGAVFLFVGVRHVLEQYGAPDDVAARPLPPSPSAAAMRIAFPLIITPYGIAALILLLAESRDAAATTTIVGIAIGVMILNLIAMLTARWILGGLTIVILQILGAVLAVLQVGLAVEMILRGARYLGVLNG